MFETRQTNELMSILAAGGGITLRGSVRTTQDLMSLAAAARTGGARLILTEMQTRSTQEVLSISAAGKGHVEFA